jgi:hypothetical protein
VSITSVVPAIWPAGRSVARFPRKSASMAPVASALARGAPPVSVVVARSSATAVSAAHPAGSVARSAAIPSRTVSTTSAYRARRNLLHITRGNTDRPPADISDSRPVRGPVDRPGLACRNSEWLVGATWDIEQHAAPRPPVSSPAANSPSPD